MLTASVRRVRPFWRPSVGLSDDNIGSVGFLFVERQGPGTVGLSPVGTFFLVQIPTEADPFTHYTFLVTAQHVIQEHNTMIAMMRGSGGEVLAWHLDDPWFVPDD